MLGCKAPSIGVRRSKDGDRCYTYLHNTSNKAEEDLVEVRAWLDTVGRYVALRDGLCQSFALDFDRINGSPTQPRTDVATLRARAKPYGGPSTTDGLLAADELATRMNTFIDEMTCYKFADCVVAVPPSNMNKPFDLPTHLAAKLGEARDLEILSSRLRTVASRPQLKNVVKSKKVEVLSGTVKADEGIFEGRSVLLVDDLYQSGASANMAAVKLLEAGAKRVLGLFCEKTCRNDDNV